MDYLERSHAYQSLLVPMIQVHGDIPIVDALHVGIKDSSCQSGVFLIVRQPVKESRITGNPYDFTVQILDVTTGFGRVHTFHGASRQGVVAERNITAGIIVRYDILQLRTVVCSKGSPCPRIAYGRNGSFFSTGMVEGFTFYIYIRGMRFPIHGKSRKQPFRLCFCQPDINIRLAFQLSEHFFRPRFITYQLQSSLFSTGISQITRMPLGKIHRQSVGLCLQ